MTQKRLIDLSHPIEEQMRTYPGLEGPHVTTVIGHENSEDHYCSGTTFHIGQVTIVGNTGTYIDAPFHRYSDGIDIGQLPLEKIADLPALLFRAPVGVRAIGPEIFGDVTLAGHAVLVQTDWSKHWRTEYYFKNHPFLTREAAEYLCASEATLVGIDSLNIDSTDDATRPVHSLLLAQGIPVVEHLTQLDQLPATGFFFSAVPAPVRGMASFPVRAYARLSQH